MSEPRLTILTEPCDGCPWKGRLELAAGRLRDLREACERDDAPFVCHKTIVAADRMGCSVSPVWDDGIAVCPGWLEAARRIGRVPTIVQVAERLELTEEVPPP